MNKLFTKEQARQFLKENNLKDADSIGDALVAQFKDLLQEALEAEMDHELGYSKYDWKNKESKNSRNGLCSNCCTWSLLIHMKNDRQSEIGTKW